MLISLTSCDCLALRKVSVSALARVSISSSFFTCQICCSSSDVCALYARLIDCPRARATLCKYCVSMLDLVRTATSSSLSLAMISLRSSTSCSCNCFSVVRSACSFFTAAETSFSLAMTSRIMSFRAFSSSTVVVNVENEVSRSSRSVLESRFCSVDRSVWIFERFSAMFGFPLRLRQSSIVDSRSAFATSLTCSWFSMNLLLLESALREVRCAISCS
mmetsp:Transcript_45168/g.118540  ORF Transcript_45168/g.118540 Transcript_45168/m.118540 type:complete len:218 (+) Transcript_45168:525-1178(+)